MTYGIVYIIIIIIIIIINMRFRAERLVSLINRDSPIVRGVA